jgi:hypothetical protein
MPLNIPRKSLLLSGTWRGSYKLTLRCRTNAGTAWGQKSTVMPEALAVCKAAVAQQPEQLSRCQSADALKRGEVHVWWLFPAKVRCMPATSNGPLQQTLLSKLCFAWPSSVLEAIRSPQLHTRLSQLPSTRCCGPF